MLLSHRSGKKLVVIFIFLPFTSIYFLPFTTKINITKLLYYSEVLPNRTVNAQCTQ